MIGHRSPCPQPRRGAVVPMVAILLVLLITILAIVIDLGFMLDRRRDGQTTADSASLAGAAKLAKTDAATARTAALAFANHNGYTNNGTSNTPDPTGRFSVTVNIPPLSGPNTGKPLHVEVITLFNQQRSFSSILGSGALPVRARSVARCKNGAHGWINLV